MKLYYLQSNNRIITVKYEDEVFKFDTSTLSPFNAFEIDEVDPLNKSLCIDLVRACNRIDEGGDGKYAIVGGVLLEKDNWVEKIYDI